MQAGSQACKRLMLSIAGLSIELTWAGTQMKEEPAQKFYRGFLFNGRPGSADVRLHLHCGELPAVKPEALIFDAVENHWRLVRLNGHYVFECFHPKPPHPLVQRALLVPDFRSGEIYRRPDETGPGRAWSLVQLMRPFGELLLVNLLSQGRGVLVHALGVSDRGRGLLFVGRSGAGKSTLATLYEGDPDVTVLGDERVIVTHAGGQFWLSGTPWPGGAFTVSPQTVPLRRIFFLEHGLRNELLAESFLSRYGLLFQQLFLPFWSAEALAFATGFVGELLATLPSHRLAFVNDARVIEFLRAHAEN